MLQKKGGVLNFTTLALVSSKKTIEIHSYCQRYENYKGFAIIHDFTAHWVIQYEQMVNIWNFNTESESSQLKLRIIIVPMKDVSLCWNWIDSSQCTLPQRKW